MGVRMDHGEKCKDGIWPGSWGSLQKEVTPTHLKSHRREGVSQEEKDRPSDGSQEGSPPLQVPDLALKTLFS